MLERHISVAYLEIVKLLLQAFSRVIGELVLPLLLLAAHMRSLAGEHDGVCWPLEAFGSAVHKLIMYEW